MLFPMILMTMVLLVIVAILSRLIYLDFKHRVRKETLVYIAIAWILLVTAAAIWLI